MCSACAHGQAPVCPGAYSATGCCYKNCQEDTIPASTVANTIESGDGWELVSAALADAEDVIDLVCDFGGAACEYADSDLGKVVDRIAKIGAKLPPPIGTEARAYTKVKTSLTRAFKCRDGESIRCARTEALLDAMKSSGATPTCPAAAATGLAIGMALAISQCAL
jgi:hypothetical protein